MEYRVISETDTFLIAVGNLPQVGRFTPYDTLDKYMVINKEHGVIEYISEVYYYAKGWADQMEEALKQVDGDTPIFAPPNGQIN
jgi:hypothetical protein